VTRPTERDDLFRGSLRVGQVGGVSVRLHWSVFALFLLVVGMISAATLPAAYPDRALWAYAVAGFVAALLLLLGLLAHEVSHAVVAQHHGVQVNSITLWMLGGIAQLGRESPDPDTDLKVAGVGPLVSLLLGGLFGLLALGLSAAGLGGLPVGTVAWLAGINVLLAAFNMIPAAPLDGGRVLRALLWKRSGDRDRAAETATRTGRVLGLALAVLGLTGFLLTGRIDALWLAVIGWFIAGSAAAEQQAARQQRALHGIAVGDVMSPHPEVAPPDIRVAEFVDTYLFRSHHTTFPLVAGDRLVGLLTLRRVKAVAPPLRATTTLGEIACPLPEVCQTTPEEPLVDLLPRLNASKDHRALVLTAGELVGVVSPTDVSRAAQRAALITVPRTHR
jgi:Zn-dependent protease/CBS domain-containing protein